MQVTVDDSSWVTLSAGALVASTAGSTYTWGSYSAWLRTAINATERDIALISSLSSAGLYCSFLGGWTYDAYGPFIVAIVGSVLSLLGYTLTWAGALHKIPYTTAWMCLYNILWQHGSGWLQASVIATNVRNFNKSSGLAVGLLRSVVGISASCFTLILNSVFERDVGDFLLFMGLYISGIGFICAFFIRMRQKPPRRPISDSDRKRILWGYGITFLLAIYVSAVAALYGFNELRRRRVLIAPIFVTMVALMALLARTDVLLMRVPAIKETVEDIERVLQESVYPSCCCRLCCGHKVQREASRKEGKTVRLLMEEDGGSGGRRRGGGGGGGGAVTAEAEEWGAGAAPARRSSRRSGSSMSSGTGSAAGGPRRTSKGSVRTVGAPRFADGPAGAGAGAGDNRGAAGAGAAIPSGKGTVVIGMPGSTASASPSGVSFDSLPSSAGAAGAAGRVIKREGSVGTGQYLRSPSVASISSGSALSSSYGSSAMSASTLSLGMGLARHTHSVASAGSSGGSTAGQSIPGDSSLSTSQTTASSEGEGAGAGAAAHTGLLAQNGTALSAAGALADGGAAAGADGGALSAGEGEGGEGETEAEEEEDAALDQRREAFRSRMATEVSLLMSASVIDGLQSRRDSQSSSYSGMSVQGKGAAGGGWGRGRSATGAGTGPRRIYRPGADDDEEEEEEGEEMDEETGRRYRRGGGDGAGEEEEEEEEWDEEDQGEEETEQEAESRAVAAAAGGDCDSVVLSRSSSFAGSSFAGSFSGSFSSQGGTRRWSAASGTSYITSFSSSSTPAEEESGRGSRASSVSSVSRGPVRRHYSADSNSSEGSGGSGDMSALLRLNTEMNKTVGRIGPDGKPLPPDALSNAGPSLHMGDTGSARGSGRRLISGPAPSLSSSYADSSMMLAGAGRGAGVSLNSSMAAEDGSHRAGAPSSSTSIISSFWSSITGRSTPASTSAAAAAGAYVEVEGEGPGATTTSSGYSGAADLPGSSSSRESVIAAGAGAGSSSSAAPSRSSSFWEDGLSAIGSSISSAVAKRSLQRRRSSGQSTGAIGASSTRRFSTGGGGGAAGADGGYASLLDGAGQFADERLIAGLEDDADAGEDGHHHHDGSSTAGDRSRSSSFFSSVSEGAMRLAKAAAAAKAGAGGKQKKQKKHKVLPFAGEADSFELTLSKREKHTEQLGDTLRGGSAAVQAKDLRRMLQRMEMEDRGQVGQSGHDEDDDDEESSDSSEEDGGEQEGEDEEEEEEEERGEDEVSRSRRNLAALVAATTSSQSRSTSSPHSHSPSSSLAPNQKGGSQVSNGSGGRNSAGSSSAGGASAAATGAALSPSSRALPSHATTAAAAANGATAAAGGAAGGASFSSAADRAGSFSSAFSGLTGLTNAASDRASFGSRVSGAVAAGSGPGVLAGSSGRSDSSSGVSTLGDGSDGRFFLEVQDPSAAAAKAASAAEAERQLALQRQARQQQRKGGLVKKAGFADSADPSSSGAGSGAERGSSRTPGRVGRQGSGYLPPSFDNSSSSDSSLLLSTQGSGSVGFLPAAGEDSRDSLRVDARDYRFLPPGQVPSYSSSPHGPMQPPVYSGRGGDKRGSAGAEGTCCSCCPARCSSLSCCSWLWGRFCSKQELKKNLSSVKPLPGATVGQGLLSWEFIAFYYVMYVCSGSGLFFSNTVGSITESLNASSSTGDLYVIIFSICSCSGRLLFGVLSDLMRARLSRPAWAVVTCALMAIGLCVYAVSPSLSTLYASTACIGLSFGGLWTLTGPFLADRFGLRSFGSLTYIASTATAVGSFTLTYLLASNLYEIQVKGNTSSVCMGPECYRLTFWVLGASTSVVHWWP